MQGWWPSSKLLLTSPRGGWRADPKRVLGLAPVPGATRARETRVIYQSGAGAGADTVKPGSRDVPASNTLRGRINAAASSTKNSKFYQAATTFGIILVAGASIFRSAELGFIG